MDLDPDLEAEKLDPRVRPHQGIPDILESGKRKSQSRQVQTRIIFDVIYPDTMHQGADISQRTTCLILRRKLSKPSH